MHGLTKVAVLGAGSWGTALAIQLSRHNIEVRLWGHLPDEMRKMQADRINQTYLPDFPFPDSLQPQTSLENTLQDADEILIAVPSHAFASVIAAIKPHLRENSSVCWATKGLDPVNNALLSEVCDNILGERAIAVISGPTFAAEVAAGLPTAIVVASRQAEHAKRLVSYLRDTNFRPYTSNDLIGVQVGGAAKNIMAIAAGISDGLGFGANSRAALITRGLVEISRLGEALGGHAETFMGLAGLGDLVLTCTDDQSRNRRFGLALAGGLSVKAARGKINQEVEGITTTKEIYLKAKSLGIEMPITEQTYRVLFEDLPAKEAVKALLSRHTRPELD